MLVCVKVVIVVEEGVVGVVVVFVEVVAFVVWFMVGCVEV